MRIRDDYIEQVRYHNPDRITPDLIYPFGQFWNGTVIQANPMDGFVHVVDAPVDAVTYQKTIEELSR